MSQLFGYPPPPLTHPLCVSELKKDPGIPNLFPFKEQLLQQMQARKERVEGERERQKLQRQREQAKKRRSLQSMQNDVQKRQKEFEKKVNMLLLLVVFEYENMNIGTYCILTC